nr:hypothetical protein [Paenibacillus larvae]
MAQTLPEAAKLSTDMLQKGVIETYAKSSPVLELLPFMEIAGNSYRYNQEGTLPGIGFRGVNEGYQESTGVLNPQSEGLVISGAMRTSTALSSKLSEMLTTNVRSKRR